MLISGMLIPLITGLAAPVEPVNTTCIAYAQTPPDMDGLLDDCYGEMMPTEIFNPTGWDGAGDFTAYFYLCGDPSYLYVLANITDDINHSYNWNVGNSWEFDNVELFLQLDTNTVTTSYDGATIQLRICRGLDSVESAGRAARTDYQYYMEAESGQGWIAEVAVPWTAVLPSGAAPEDIMDYINWGGPIGFDFSGADSDNSDGEADIGNRDVQSAWDMDDPADPEDRTEDLAWNNTSVFGYATLFMCGNAFETVNKDQAFSLVPNPADHFLRMDSPEKMVHVEIYSIRGMKVMESNYHPGAELDISGLKSGLYTVIVDGNPEGKLIKK